VNVEPTRATSAAPASAGDTPCATPITSGPTPAGSTPAPPPAPTPTSRGGGGGGGGSLGLTTLFLLAVLWLGRTRQRRVPRYFRCNR
jgi:hypothetical protein